MKSKSQTRFTFLLVAPVALFSWWLLSTEQEKQTASTDNNHFIDLFVNQFTLTTTNNSGDVEYTLKANRLEHYNDEDSSKIFKPMITIPQQNGDWLISAEHGEIDDQQTLIQLHNNVIMKQLNTSEEIEIKSQSMTINTKLKTINSKEDVTIHSGSLALNSRGMHFDGNSNKLSLLSNVSGIYLPK